MNRTEESEHNSKEGSQMIGDNFVNRTRSNAQTAVQTPAGLPGTRSPTVESRKSPSVGPEQFIEETYYFLEQINDELY